MVAVHHFGFWPSIPRKGARHRSPAPSLIVRLGARPFPGPQKPAGESGLRGLSFHDLFQRRRKQEKAAP